MPNRTYYEDYQCDTETSIEELIMRYGHKPEKWKAILQTPLNAKLAQKYLKYQYAPTLQAYEILYIPIPWTMKTASMRSKQYTTSSGLIQPQCEINIPRYGEPIPAIEWLQTCYYIEDGEESLQKVDPDRDVYPSEIDDKPFYFDEYQKDFYDAPSNLNLQFRACLSLGVVTNKRVRLYETKLWGADFSQDKAIPYSLRTVPAHIFRRHLEALNKGQGKTIGKSFEKMEWCIDAAPPSNFGPYFAPY